MKKTLLAASLATAMGIASTAEAAFTPMGPGAYSMSITGGCFDFGDCQASGNGIFTDNTAGQALFTTTANTLTTRAVGSIVGSGTVGDTNGTIEFTLDAAGNMTITSYAQDSYLATAGGTFYVDALGLSSTSAMTGTIDGGGNVLLTPIGREGLAAQFNSAIGTQPWNDSKKIGMYDAFSTGTTTNDGKGTTPAFSVTGTPLQDTGVNSWSGILASTGNINGDNWNGFNNVQYAEIFNVSVALVTGLPDAVDDNLSTQLATALNININNSLIVPNDVHGDANETLTFVSFDDSATDAGSTISESGGVITYTPNPAFTDPSNDSFTYTITDGVGVQSTATVTIIVTDAPPPIANADDVATAEDTPLILDPVHGTLSVAGVVLDSDPDPTETAGLLISAVDAFSVNSGTITKAAGTNDLTYTPAADFVGTDTFSYTIANSIPLSASTTVTITVAGINDAPVCTDATLTTAVDTTLLIDVAADLLSTTSTPPQCVDAEGDAVLLSTIDADGSVGGTISDDGAGTLTYTPPSGYLGAETFSYTATDGVDVGAPNVLTINVANPLADNFTMLNKTGDVFGGTNDVVFDWDEVSFNTTTVTNSPGSGLDVASDLGFGDFMTIASPESFFGFNWTAHHIRVFKNTSVSPITLNFDVTCTAADYDGGVVDCNRPLIEQGATQQYLTLTLQPGEIGAHILFDWNITDNIDVVILWKENEMWDKHGESDASTKNELWLGQAGLPPARDTDWSLVSTDVPGDGKDGINGSPMVDGAFLGFYANFNYKPTKLGVALPPYTGEISEAEVDGFSMGLWSLLGGLLTLFGLRGIKNKK